MSKKGFLGKTLAVVGAVAAIGGVCYVFRDKIKESKLYKDFDVDDKVKKAKSFVNDKLPNSCDCESDDFEDDFFYDEDEDDMPSTPVQREYTSITPQTEDDTNEIIDDNFQEIDTNNDEVNTNDSDTDSTTSIPTISFDDLADSEEDDSPIGYENEGLSDVSEDPDVLIDQDKLEF